MPHKKGRSKGRSRGSGAGAGAGAGAAWAAASASHASVSTFPGSLSPLAVTAGVKLVMGEIVSYMDSYRDLGRMQSVCVALRDGVRRSSVSHHVQVGRLHGRHLGGFRRSFPHAAAVTIAGVTNEDLASLRGMTSLRSLQLGREADVTDDGMASLLAGEGALSALTALAVPHSWRLAKPTTERLAALRFLTELSLPSRCLAFGGCAAIASMGGLRSLKVCTNGYDGCEAACDVPPNSVDDQCVCAMGPGADDIVAMVAGLTSLTELELDGFQDVSGTALSAIAAMPALTSLEVDCTYLTYDEDPPSLECLRGATGLTKLALTNMYHFAWDSGMEALLSGDGALTALTSLDITECSMLSGATTELLAAMPCLRELALPSGCLGVHEGHDGCAATARMSGLRSLRVQGCDANGCVHCAGFPAHTAIRPCLCRTGPSAAGIVTMVAGLTELTELRLDDCKLVSGTALRAIAAMPAVTSLRLRNVSGPMDGDDPPSLGCLLELATTRLTRLDLTGCVTWVPSRVLALLGNSYDD